MAVPGSGTAPVWAGRIHGRQQKGAVVSIWRWADWIEPVAPEARISLGEGSTPLIRSQVIGPQAGLQNLFFKLESTNPTGSFKDRFAAAAI